MYNFHITFAYPWLLWLLVPAVAFTLVPYFMLSKKYRKTRNRITSIVLHLMVVVLAVSVLSELKFSYAVANMENEILLVVDVSDTQKQSEKHRDDFIQSVLSYGKNYNFKIGVVTFGFDQIYAVPLTHNIDSIYTKYLDAPLPDTSATNIAGALTYAKELFTKPQSSKIVLVTDGKETDNKATDVIRSVAAQGTKVDVVDISSGYADNDIQLLEVQFPDYHIKTGDPLQISVTVRSKSQTLADIELIDNGVSNPVTGKQSVALAEGVQTIVFEHVFDAYGLHEITFKLSGTSSSDDALPQNNILCSYIYLDVYNKILILERYDQESALLAAMLSADELFEVEVMNIADQNIPATVDALRAYDQVIMNNIANRDMPFGFVQLLNTYVREGGGLLTVGGKNEFGEANAYNRVDMRNTLYQQMLPVQAIDYTPPLGLMVIIDRSGSMSTVDNESGLSKLEWAKAGAVSCLSALSERDYFGLMTLDSEFNLVLQPTPRPQESKILAAISSIEKAEGGTVFAGAIDRAGRELTLLNNVDKRHIILVTDGGAGDDALEYEKLIKDYYEQRGITFSIVAISPTTSAVDKMKAATDLGHGRLHAISDSSQLTTAIKDDIRVPDILDVNHESFQPIINNPLSPIVQGIEQSEDPENKGRMTVSLDGFYGVKVRDSVKNSGGLILTGDYDVPIYAQWKYAKGMVGSFMCDLSGDWSKDFLEDENGSLFIINAVSNLMPTENIRPSEFSVKIEEDNYTNRLSVTTSWVPGEKINGKIIESVEDNPLIISLNDIESNPQDADCYVTLALSEGNYYTRSNFIVKKSGIYKIFLEKVDAEGNIVATYETYKEFSYSEEYNLVAEKSQEDLRANLSKVAEGGNGVLIGDTAKYWQVFENFETAVTIVYDPRMLFAILAIVLFLADIAVRKFKFKWPHELIRAYRKKSLSKTQGDLHDQPS